MRRIILEIPGDNAVCDHVSYKGKEESDDVSESELQLIGKDLL